MAPHYHAVCKYMDQKISAHIEKVKYLAPKNSTTLFHFFRDSNPFLPSSMFIETKWIDLTILHKQDSTTGNGMWNFRENMRFFS